MPSDDIFNQEYGADLSLAGPSSTSLIVLAAYPTVEEPSTKPTPLRRSTRDRIPNPRYADNISCTFALLVSDPIYFEDAEEEDKWYKAMEEEMLAIQKNQTWDLVDSPERKKAIGLKWVLRTKYHVDGSIQKHKARLVAKGYSQQQVIDFKETFSPGSRFETMRILLSLAANLNWPVYQFDVKCAFLNDDLEEKVYISQPEGFLVNG